MCFSEIALGRRTGALTASAWTRADRPTGLASSGRSLSWNKVEVLKSRSMVENPFNLSNSAPKQAMLSKTNVIKFWSKTNLNRQKSLQNRYPGRKALQEGTGTQIS